MAIVRAQEAFSSMSRHAYQVFLSFRGVDVRNTFCDHLYTALVNAGIRTFRDDDEVEAGENIKLQLNKAIRESRISVILFSENYASSRWCLDELVQILERGNTADHTIVPVFYHVAPSHVRHQKGKFAEAFAKHEMMYKAEMDKVKRWKAALEEVADLKGMELQDGYESKFIQKIVTLIGIKVNPTVLSIGPYLVGIESRVKSINFWLQDRSTDVSIMVICGMGGIGKTTIAKYVFNLNVEGFEGSSFLANIREISKQPSGLIDLQRQLLSDVVKGRKEKISNVDEGKIKIRDAICWKRILVVLDEVDKEDQLDAVLGTRNWFYPGSKIIITTRHLKLLKAHEVHKILNVEKLDNDESFELFSWHAFGRDHPTKAYTKLAKRVIQHCGGLPLALQISGSSLSGKSVDVWESALEKLEAIPDSQIQKKLKISYDSLQDDHDKNLFLEIACFFIGKDKDFIVKILDECDFHTIVGIQHLLDRSLLTIEDNKLMMHQLLRDMGREIIREESPKKPGERSRLWDHMESFNVLKEKTGTEAIEGLVLDMHMLMKHKSARKIFSASNAKPWHKSLLPNESNSNEMDFESDAFISMQRLRLLHINHVQLTGGYKEFPKKLRSLCWRGFPLKYLPSDFPLESLVAIDMRNSSLEQVWEGIKLLVSLKILNLSHCHGLTKTPNFLGLPNLERLILKDCVSLAELHESIVILEGLVLLNLKDCKNLGTFPRNIGRLKRLETLIISGCSKLHELPRELSKMESLKVFHADGTALNLLPSTTRKGTSWDIVIWSWLSKPRKVPELSWASFPRSLVRLSLSNCNLSDDAFPRDFSNLPFLQNLNLSKNPICDLPDCIRGPTRLQKLELHSGTRLQPLIGLPSINDSSVGCCTALEKKTYQSTSCCAKIFHVNRCEKLVEMQGVFKLEPMGNINADMINFFGWHNLEPMGSIEVKLYNNSTNTEKKGPIQGLSEYGLFSTFFRGREIPGWFSPKSTGSSISFTVPSLPNLRIRGLNVCAVYAPSNKKEYWYAFPNLTQKDRLPHPLFTKVSNKSKGLKWIYGPSCFGIPEDNEDMIWLSHWKYGNQLEGGDKVSVSIVVDDGFQVKECGINLVYDQEEIMGTQHDIYPSCQGVNDADLSACQVRTGLYFLCDQAVSSDHDWTSSDWFKCLFGDSDDETTGPMCAMKQIAGKGKSSIFKHYKRRKNDTDEAITSKKDGPTSKNPKKMKRTDFINKQKDRNPSTTNIKEVTMAATECWNKMVESERAKYRATTQEWNNYWSEYPAKPPKKKDHVVKCFTTAELRDWDGGASSGMPPQSDGNDHRSPADLYTSILKRKCCIEDLLVAQATEMSILASMLNKNSQNTSLFSEDDRGSGPSFEGQGNANTDEAPHVPKEATPQNKKVRQLVRLTKLGAKIKSPFELELGERHRSISSRDKAITNYVWSHCPSSEIVVDMYRMFLYQHDIETLYGSNWVNDSVMDMYARMLNAIDLGLIKRHIFDCSFSIMVQNYQSKKITKKAVLKEFSSHYKADIIGRNLEECSIFFLPICWRQTHWIALIVNTTNCCVEYLDSMNKHIIPGVSDFDETMRVVFEMILTELHGKSFPLSKYPLIIADVPKQHGYDDCGVYVMKFMQLWNGRIETPLYPCDGDKYRIELAASLILHESNACRDAVVKKSLMYQDGDIDTVSSQEKE